MPTEPNQRQLEDKSIPTISLGGKEWPVRRLALEQLCEVAPILVARQVALEMFIHGGEAARSNLTADLLHDVSKVIYWGLKRGHPGMTPDEFNAMEVSLAELRVAFAVVASQANGLTSRKAAPDPLDGSPAPSPAEAGAG